MVGAGLGAVSACGGEAFEDGENNKAGSPGSAGTHQDPGSGGKGGTRATPAGGGRGSTSAGGGAPAAGAGGSEPDPGVDPTAKTFTLKVTTMGEGKVTSSPPGDIDCGATCSKRYEATGSSPKVLLTATSGSMTQFTGWGGDCGGAGDCLLTMNADREVSAVFAEVTECPAGNPNNVQHVDHVHGTDDLAHGSAIGSCAFKTLAFALAHSKGSVELLGIDTFPGDVIGEETPYTLTGSQKLICNNAKFTVATGAGYAGLISIAGIANTVNGCRIDGADNGGYCAVGNTAGTHTFSKNTLAGCANVAIFVASTVSGISFIDNTFTENFVGIMFEGINGATLTNNSMVSSGNDVVCQDASLAVTGSGNVRGGGSVKCLGCANCPF